MCVKWAKECYVMWTIEYIFYVTKFQQKDLCLFGKAAHGILELTMCKVAFHLLAYFIVVISV